MEKVIKLLKQQRSETKDVQFKAQIDNTLDLIEQSEVLRNIEVFDSVKEPNIIYDNDIPF